MFWGIIHRSIFFELLKTYLVCLTALTGMILMAGLVGEAMREGFGPMQLLSIIPFFLPCLLPYTVPTSTLFSTCLVYGRLAADNEILALKASGIHIRHVMWPAVFLGVASSSLILWFYLDLIPSTNFALRTQALGNIEEVMYMMLRKQGAIKHPRLNYEIHAKSLQGRKLIDPLFMRKAADGSGFDVVAYAKEAELRMDVAHKCILVDMRRCDISHRDGAVGYVESRIWSVEIPQDFGKGGVKPVTQMTWTELCETEEQNQRDKQKFNQEIDSLESRKSLSSLPGQDQERLQYLLRAKSYNDQQICGIHGEWHTRPAMALGCLCFALVGCPVGIWFGRSDYLSAFITSFMPIVIVYYPLMLCMMNMSSSGKIPPWLGVYGPDALMLGAGMFLFRRLSRQ